MNDDLEQAFYSYIQIAFEALGSASERFHLVDRIDSMTSLDTAIKRAVLHEVIGELECGDHFARLVDTLLR